jgi:SEL1 protein
MFDKSVKLYTQLTEVVVNSFLISKDSPVIEPVRLHNGSEENKEALRKSKGEEDEDFQIRPRKGMLLPCSKSVSFTSLAFVV